MKKSILLLFLALGFFTSTNAHTQKGVDINGEATINYSGFSVSMPDMNTLAVGAYGNNGTGALAGHVRIYKWSGTAWVQKGADIDGEATIDFSGYSVSMPDSNTVAIGAIQNGGNGASSGHVRVYTWNGAAWVQKGADINGESAGDNSGYSVSMPDVNTLAIGAINNDGGGSNAGQVRVYSWNGSAWVQKGVDINGEGAGDNFGFSVSMPDANTFAVGAICNDGTAANAGHARVYTWNGSAWVKKGSDIDGEAVGDSSGCSVSMPGPNILAIGARNNDGGGSNAGQVRVYRWNGSAWVKQGSDIDGEAAGDKSGYAVCMPDSNTVAVGANENDGTASNAGHVRVYRWYGNKWDQHGPEINGEAANDKSGNSVSMPDSSIIAIGGPQNDGTAADAGHVRVYVLCSHTYKTISASNCSTYTSPSGLRTWTVSGTYNDTIANAAGCDSIITINLTIKNTTSIISTSNCYAYTSPSGIYTWTASGTYMDTIPNMAGCDSMITINLTINNNTTGTISPSSCYSYTSPSSNYTWTLSGTYMDTIPNAAGCDSIITINLTIKNNSTGSISPSNCESYTSPSGNYTWTTSGTYMDTIPNAIGCDSIITVNLTIKNKTTSAISPISCYSYTSPSTSYTWTVSGTFMDTIPNAIGCDSVITINLTINNNTTSTISPNSCDAYTSPSGTYTWTTSGTYMDTIPSAGGCDSLITINLTINNSTSSAISPSSCYSYTSPSGIYTWTTSGTYMDTIPNATGCDSLISINLTIKTATNNTITPSACDSYTSPSGNYTWTVSGTFTDTIANAAACDSIITIQLTINTVDTAVTALFSTLTSNATGATYQWVNCSGYVPISGATNANYTATVNGTYAVIVTQNGCTDTSGCRTITGVAVMENTFANNIHFYPNPTTGKLIIEMLSAQGAVLVSITNMLGQEVMNKQFNSTSRIDLDIEGERGVYFIKLITNNNQIAVIRAMKE